MMKRLYSLPQYAVLAMIPWLSLAAILLLH
jgi:hypothetical protein